MSYKVIAVGNVMQAGKFKKQDLVLREENGDQKTITRWQKFEPSLNPGDIIDGEVREGKEYKGQMQYSIDKVKIVTKASGAVVTSASKEGGSFPDKRITVGEYLGAMKAAHALAKELEPTSPEVRGTLVNTFLIALTNDKIQKDKVATEEPKAKVTKKKKQVVEEEEEVVEREGAEDSEGEDF